MNVPLHVIRCRRRRQTGFNFSEVLFAVMILGIGFIMIAAIFPVALTQTKLTTEESAAATQTAGAVHYLQQYATDNNLPPTASAPNVLGSLQPLPNGADSITAAMGGNVISTANPRQGLIPLYRRSVGWPYAQIVFLPVQSRNRSVYTPGGDFGPNNATPLTFRVRVLTVANNFRAATRTNPTTQITFNGAQADIDALGEGTYIVVSEHNVMGSVPQNYLAGHIYRLGTKVDPSDNKTWNLMPGSDFRVEPGLDGKLSSADDVTTMKGATVFFVGRDTDDPGAGASQSPTGVAQDVSAFTTFIDLR